MIAQLLSTGNEVLLGDIVDTNAAFIARQLKDVGIEVQKAITVGDHIGTITETLMAISRKAQVCIVTGGLGPTWDDVTAAACADAAGEPLVKNREALDSMRAFFKKRGVELTFENQDQAMMPKTAGVLVNDHGTAPGFYIKINQCLFFFLPGVPSEMRLMFEKKAIPVLKKQFKISDVITINRLSIFGLPESQVGSRLAGFKDTFPDLTLGFRVRFPLIEVKILARHLKADRALMADSIKAAAAWAKDQLGDKVISETGLSMAQEIGRLLVAQKKTVAVAESCTGGLIANMLTDVSGSSDYFLFSGVTYSNDAKTCVLGVKKETILKFGAVHEQTAREMAMGARKKAGADIAISTTGIAGPTGGTKDKPVGMVCIGLAARTVCRAKTYTFPFEDRIMNKKMFAATAMEMMRQYLISNENS